MHGFAPHPPRPTLAVCSLLLWARPRRVQVVRYIGRVHFASGVWVGVQLNRPTGLIDGTVTNGRTGEKRTYFTCKANYVCARAPEP